MVRGHFDLDRQRHLMVCPVNAEDAVDLNGGCALGQDFAFDVIGMENDVGVLGALENFLMHLLIAHAIAGVAAGGIEYHFATDIARRWVVIDLASLKVKSSVDGVECVSKGKRNRCFGGNKLENYSRSLSVAADSAQNQHY